MTDFEEEGYVERMAIIRAGLDQLEAFLRESVIPSAVRIERLTVKLGGSEGLAEAMAHSYAQKFLTMITNTGGANG